MKELSSISFFNQALSVREQAKLRQNYRQILEYIVECRVSRFVWTVDREPFVDIHVYLPPFGRRFMMNISPLLASTVI